MHGGSDVPAPAEGGEKLAWYRGLSGYHWFVLLVCWLGWLFDTMDQQFFILSRKPAIGSLMGAQADINFYSGIATACLVLGWATGGIIFGILGDRWGRAKTLVTSVLCYSVFTGLSALSVSWVDFTLYRFLTGMGVGGAFAAAVSLVAETLPARSRPYALGFLQVLGAVGNMLAACISYVIKPSMTILGVPGWRLLFVVGIVPAILVLLVMRRLKEPEGWVKAKEAQARGEKSSQKMGSVAELFGDPRWRHNVIVGILLSLTGVIGLWGIGFWQPELVRDVVKKSRESLQKAGEPRRTAEEIQKMEQETRQMADTYVSTAQLLFNGGAAVGTYLFAILMARVGRRPAFALIFCMSLVTVFAVFGFMSRPDQVWWMAPVLGIGTLTVFGGYSIYFPELFPTRLRATGVGFCYNTARYVAAAAPFTLGLLADRVYRDSGLTTLSSMGGQDSPFRYAALTVSVIFFMGLVVLFVAPETKGKPLPE